MTIPTQKFLNQLLIFMNYDYDGGTGPSQHEREKQQSTRHIFVAEQLGQDFHDFGVELDTE